jgi:hypothetical protein
MPSQHWRLSAVTATQHQLLHNVCLDIAVPHNDIEAMVVDDDDVYTVNRAPSERESLPDSSSRYLEDSIA